MPEALTSTAPQYNAGMSLKLAHTPSFSPGSMYETRGLPAMIWQKLNAHEPLHHATLQNLRHQANLTPEEVHQAEAAILAEHGTELQNPDHVLPLAAQMGGYSSYYDHAGNERAEYKGFDPQILVNFLITPGSIDNLQAVLQRDLLSRPGKSQIAVLQQMQSNLEKLHTLVSLNLHHLKSVHDPAVHPELHARHAEVHSKLKSIREWLSRELCKFLPKAANADYFHDFGAQG